ncbi:MAG: menaquinol-cytochrome c reductase iron-sulfur subunit [Verrucomicrobiota bacterium]|jgi:menaquinol-cytochrome c reductase iron-sulfur subunit
MSDNTTDHQSEAESESPEALSRRRFLEKLSITLGGLCAAIIGVPLVGFVIAPLFRKTPEQWTTLGKVGDFQIGKTVSVTVLDTSPLPWAGITAKNAVWLRRENENSFIAFSTNCTHLGCPVRWMEGADLFLCPCHGGVYYKDGSVAAGPPPRPLFRYDVRVENGEVKINSVVVPISTTL